MWFIQPKQNYISTIPWKHTEESALSSWQIRARNYHTHPADNWFAVLFSLLIGFFASFLGDDSLLLSFIYGGGMFLFTLLITMSMTHQTAILVYRFTDAHAEVFSWKPQADSVKPVMKWTAILSGVVVVVLILIDPAFVIAAIGPVGLGIAAAVMGTSQKQHNIWRHEQHHDFEWHKTETIRVWRKRNLIALTYPWKPFSKNSRYRPRTEYIFCHKDELDERIAFFRQHLPEAKYEEGPITVYT